MQLCPVQEKILEEFLMKKKYSYNNIVYVGDGHNDFCPGTILTPKDYIFPRFGFKLHNMTMDLKYRNLLKCNIVSWKNGQNIITWLMKIL